ncbi:hypothetical protein C8R44DRAFT_733447 [Mycena epipterygia]|nr:hypothetical protein C8R44DRAFT_733447 [Mycena epipterygia]
MATGSGKPGGFPGWVGWVRVEGRPFSRPVPGGGFLAEKNVWDPEYTWNIGILGSYLMPQGAEARITPGPGLPATRDGPVNPRVRVRVSRVRVRVDQFIPGPGPVPIPK